MELLGYVLIGVVILTAIGMALYVLSTSGPIGWLILLGIAGAALLLIKAIRDRMRNKEDDHYTKQVKQ